MPYTFLFAVLYLRGVLACTINTDCPSGDCFEGECQEIISIDGLSDDWTLAAGRNFVGSYLDDVDDSTNAGAEVTLVDVIAPANHTLFVRWSFANAFDRSSFITQLYINLDSDYGTGYGWRGAELFAENDILYRYTGDGASFSWDSIGAVQIAQSTDFLTMEMAIGAPEVVHADVRVAFIILDLARAGYVDVVPNFGEGIFAAITTPPVCGDGVLEWMEVCEDSLSPCCSSCVAGNSGVQCAPSSGGQCDAVDYCDGINSECLDATAADMSPCDDGLACSAISACQEGVCYQVNSTCPAIVLLDGKFYEWSQLVDRGEAGVFSDALGDSTSANADIVHGMVALAAPAATKVHVRVKFASRFSAPSVMSVFINTDDDKATGYTAGWGADVMVEGSSVFTHSGADQGWGWTSAPGALDTRWNGGGTEIEVEVDLPSIARAAVDVVIVVSHGGTPADTAPDGGGVFHLALPPDPVCGDSTVHWSEECDPPDACCSGTCTILCADPCANGAKDGEETATDCGGSVCSACADGLACSSASDCTSNYCNGASLCETCPAHCDVCTGGTCADCSGGYILNTAGTCQTSCPVGEHGTVDVHLACTACAAGCKRCTGTSTDLAAGCQECADGYFDDTGAGAGGECVLPGAACAAGFSDRDGPPLASNVDCEPDATTSTSSATTAPTTSSTTATSTSTPPPPPPPPPLSTTATSTSTPPPPPPPPPLSTTAAPSTTALSTSSSTPTSSTASSTTSTSSTSSTSTTAGTSASTSATTTGMSTTSTTTGGPGQQQTSQTGGEQQEEEEDGLLGGNLNLGVPLVALLFGGWAILCFCCGLGCYCAHRRTRTRRVSSTSYEAERVYSETRNTDVELPLTSSMEGGEPGVAKRKSKSGMAKQKSRKKLRGRAVALEDDLPGGEDTLISTPTTVKHGASNARLPALDMRASPPALALNESQQSSAMVLPKIPKLPMGKLGDLDNVDEHGETGFAALHWAAQDDSAAAVRQILEVGADPDVRTNNDDAWTALHLGARKGDKDTIVALLDYGADPTLRDAKGRTPGEVATHYGHSECSGLLTGACLAMQGVTTRSMVAGAKSARKVASQLKKSKSKRRIVSLPSGPETWTEQPQALTLSTKFAKPPSPPREPKKWARPTSTIGSSSISDDMDELIDWSKLPPMPTKETGRPPRDEDDSFSYDQEGTVLDAGSSNEGSSYTSDVIVPPLPPLPKKKPG